MKITKTFVGVFLLTFLIGYVSVLPTKKQETKLSELSDSIKVSEVVSEGIPAPQIEKIAELEIITEINAWIDEENYPFKIKLLETGEGYHSDEVEAKSGEMWLGLFKENNEHYLRSTKLKIRNNGDKDVIVNDKSQPVFLLKNADKLRSGKITTLFQGLNWDDIVNNSQESDLSPDELLTTLKKDFAQKYELGGKK